MPNFRSPYQAAFSLPGHSDVRTTWTTNAFIGRRLWEGGEVYFNPELDQGFAVGPTVGLAGFANGEAQKGGATFPKFRAMRYFFRQTFGLGGEQETVEDGPNQLAGQTRHRPGHRSRSAGSRSATISTTMPMRTTRARTS